VSEQFPFSETFPHIHTPWKAIAAEYRDAIAKGDLAPGEPVGTGASVAGLYFVNPKTARKALAALAAEGLITVKRGRGYFVPGTDCRAPSVSALNVERQRAASAARVGSDRAGQP